MKPVTKTRRPLRSTCRRRSRSQVIPRRLIVPRFNLDRVDVIGRAAEPLTAREFKAEARRADALDRSAAW